MLVTTVILGRGADPHRHHVLEPRVPEAIDVEDIEAAEEIDAGPIPQPGGLDSARIAAVNPCL